MPDYIPPIADMNFLLTAVTKPAGVDPDMIGAILAEAGKLASSVLAPLNAAGDKSGARIEGGQVVTSPGFKEAYRQYCEGGWNSLVFSPDYGGQGLPWLMAFPVQEMWQAANMAFGLCPLLNQGAVEAIAAHGSNEQKQKYLPKLISGEWTGTMNLTEPQAGSDLGAVRTKAERQTDGTYRITGQKIFITYGDHDFTPNIVHLVLARIAGAPEGVKGISLFIVPKVLDNGTRNDVVPAGLEHKLGIHGSPTCTMQFGEKGGAIGYLIGQENEGLKYMFTMMNNARLSVGLQGVAIADRALQAAISYAKDRQQGKTPIIQYPDVRRMILTMKSLTEAGRALAYEAARLLDLAATGDERARALVDLLTPVVKAWCTDNAVAVASLAVQVHGGMGFIEETGVAQYYRDARILPIYEGTNGIQALDLVFRKVLKGEGRAALGWISHARENLGTASGAMMESLDLLESATRHLLSHKDNADACAAVAVPYLRLFGLVAGGVMMDRAMHAAEGYGDTAFAAAKARTALFYFDNILPEAESLAREVESGADSLLEVTPAEL
jgi:alkylation response protein AidB-like acyl-CoA dehydrogenase